MRRAVKYPYRSGGRIYVGALAQLARVDDRYRYALFAPLFGEAVRQAHAYRILLAPNGIDFLGIVFQDDGFLVNQGTHIVQPQFRVKVKKAEGSLAGAGFARIVDDNLAAPFRIEQIFVGFETI